MTASTPHKCPVCNGAGVVFKTLQSSGLDTDPCQACKGTCIVWGPPETELPEFSETKYTEYTGVPCDTYIGGCTKLAPFKVED